MTPATRAEILKLARVLRVAPERLDYLGDAAAADVARVRELLIDRLYDGDHKRLSGLANASRHLPDALVATISERVFGPLLSARVSGLLDPERAVALARRMPVAFLAELGAEIDPRRVSDVIARLPVETVAGGAREMAKRGEHVAMGRFVGHLSDTAIEACLEELSEADLLRTGFVLEGTDANDRVLALLSDERVARLGAVAEQEGLEEEARFMLEQLGDEQRARLMRLVPELS